MMKESSLLLQIRRLSRSFLQSSHQDSALKEGAREVAEATGSAVLIIAKDGAVLASQPGEGKSAEELEGLIEEGSVTGNAGLMSLIHTEETLFNEPYPAQGDKKAGQTAVAGKSAKYTIVPIHSSGKQLAALLLFQKGHNLDQDQLILAEIGASMVGMVLKQETVDQEEEDARNKELAEGAFDSLSYSEVEAINEVLKTIRNNESIVVASKIADGLGITRSVIVNALRKFESAGIIESRSLGMKGTLIRVKNRHALDMIATRSSKMSSMR